MHKTSSTPKTVKWNSVGVSLLVDVMPLAKELVEERTWKLNWGSDMEQSLWVAGNEELLSPIEGAQSETFHLHLEMWNFKIQNDLTGLSKYVIDNF